MVHLILPYAQEELIFVVSNPIYIYLSHYPKKLVCSVGEIHGKEIHGKEDADDDRGFVVSRHTVAFFDSKLSTMFWTSNT
jgi:hypothetical protein